LDEAYDIAKRTRKLLEENDFGFETPTTISLGLVTSQKRDSLDSIVSKIDYLEYHSRDEGINTISKMERTKYRLEPC